MANINLRDFDLYAEDLDEMDNLYVARKEKIKSRKDNHISEGKRERTKKIGKRDLKNVDRAV